MAAGVNSLEGINAQKQAPSSKGDNASEKAKLDRNKGEAAETKPKDVVSVKSGGSKKPKSAVEKEKDVKIKFDNEQLLEALHNEEKKEELISQTV